MKISFLLIRHPAVFEKLRAEVAVNCNDHTKLTRTDLRNMSYLQNVMKESMFLIDFNCRPRLTSASSSTVSLCPSKYQDCEQNSHTSHRRWSRWQITGADSKGIGRRL